MGFYLRKSFRFGPLRLNLSKRGVGFSVGTKGARVGVDADGREHVHGGRGGLYYRQHGGRIGSGGGGLLAKIILAAAIVFAALMFCGVLG